MIVILVSGLEKESFWKGKARNNKTMQIKKLLLMLLMNNILIFAVFADTTVFGKTWQSMDEKQKTAFVEGVNTGVRVVAAYDGGAEAQRHGKSDTPTTNFYANKYVEFLTLPFDVPTIIKKFDGFYGDEKNLAIPFDAAYRYFLNVQLEIREKGKISKEEAEKIAEIYRADWPVDSKEKLAK